MRVNGTTTSAATEYLIQAAKAVDSTGTPTTCRLSVHVGAVDALVGGAWQSLKPIALAHDAPNFAMAEVGAAGVSFFAATDSCTGSPVVATVLRITIVDEIVILATPDTGFVAVGCDGVLQPFAISRAGTFVGYG